ncbi:hypothetical protein AB685_10290 [Bacillus sp. LL01]|uniref:sigma-70 family RNA polymerase sigma factor n=1 Tax=Bacillus sp. LL01 TaxID=1665556 RepID=UPI00064D04A7|nr:sigma-70 family RNA polymerase sigma factor [Bacillus sp. LL01]KMJ58290.1 hypothetical protein AB685_10290 [Bacillus sp. LL01]
METNFNKVLEQYTPMIHHIIKSLNIYKDKDRYFHEATIALWETASSHDSTKGSFTSYAYSSVRGKLLNHLKKQMKWEATHTFVEHLPEQSFESSYFEMEGLEKYTRHLTKKQNIWLIEFIWNGKRVEEIARQEGVSISAVKSWREEALKKLRKAYTS